MSTNNIIIAGFGGQGVMSMGKLLTEAAMIENKHASFLPSYGPEMRGGTANCHVVISDQPIISPIVTEPTDLIAMNQPSLEKFKGEVVECGHIYINGQIVQKEKDELVIHPQTSRINMEVLGAFVDYSQCLRHETLIGLINQKYTGNALVENLEAYQIGSTSLKD